MAVAARKTVRGSASRSRRPSLRAVSPPRRSAAPLCRRSPSERKCRSVFRTAALVMSCVCAFGMIRVSVSSRAAATSLDAGKLQDQVMAERLVSDRLEMDRSTLQTPSRIAAIAKATMKMRDPREIDYMKLPANVRRAPTPEGAREMAPSSAAPRKAEEGAGVRGIVSRVMSTAALEGQALFVGDVGTSSSRD